MTASNPKPVKPYHPIVALAVNQPSVTISDTPTVTVKLLGRYNPLTPLTLSEAILPFRHYRRVADTTSYRRTLRIEAANPRRNFRVRARVGSSVSNTVTVYVDPAYYFSTERENGGISPFIDSTLTITVHSGIERPTTRVYFYRRSSKHGPWTRFGSSRLKRERPFEGETNLRAFARLLDRGRVQLTYCTRRPVVGDMGRPFFVRQCGAKTLR
jgi:hypothetical protein